MWCINDQLIACLAVGKAITSSDQGAQLFYLTVAAIMALVLWASVRWPVMGP